MTNKTELWIFNQALEDSYSERKFIQLAGYIPLDILFTLNEKQAMELMDAFREAINEASRKFIPAEDRKFDKLARYIPPALLSILNEDQGIALLQAFQEAIDSQGPFIDETKD